jgi:membrane-associated phospholipid phosphatase
VALACAAVVAGLAAWTVAAPEAPWAGELADLAPRRADDPLDHASLALSRATAPLGNALAAGAVALVLAAASRWRDLAVFAASVGGAGILVWALLHAVDAERPLADPLGPGSGPSFPSAHATSWAALVTAVALLAPRRARAAVVIGGGALVLAIGASRVQLGAHHPRDVVAGLALGTGWACLVAWAAGRRRAQPRGASSSSGRSGNPARRAAGMLRTRSTGFRRRL